jgi:2-polyprenyl-3-methyl-5-hydroxy-6-metoxy-1,4-benzoquinol methylase
MLTSTFVLALALASPDDADQQRFWNDWNVRFRRAGQLEQLDVATARRWTTALDWIEELHLHQPRILDLGCSTGGLTAELAHYGNVVGSDISDAAIQEAKQNYPHLEFRCGNFMSVELKKEAFDVVVAVDVLSCVGDQRAFVERVRQTLRPGGYVYIATPNRFVFERRDDVAPLGPGQVRHWNSRREIRDLFDSHFHIRRFTTLKPDGHRGLLRAVNSYKINGMLERVVPASALERTKERLGLGQTIALLAQLKTHARSPVD